MDEIFKNKRTFTDSARSRKEWPIRRHFRHLEGNSLGWNHVNELVALYSAPCFSRRSAGNCWYLYFELNQGGKHDKNYCKSNHSDGGDSAPGVADFGRHVSNFRGEGAL